MKSKLKILFISQYFYPEQFSNNTIAQFLQRSGHQVDVVSCVPNYPEGRFFEGYSNGLKREEHWNGISIHRAWTLPRGTTKFSLLRNYLTFPFTGSRTAARIGKNFDVSFVSMPSPLFQAFVGVFMRRWRKVPTVFWVQDLWPETVIHSLGLKNRLLVKVLNWICIWLYRNADLVLVQSEAFVPAIEAAGVPAQRIRFYPNSAPDTHVPLDRTPHPLFPEKQQPEKFRLMFAGNIGESQDFDTILACADRLRERSELEWVIVGSGRDLPRVEAAVKSLGLQQAFSFMGRHPQSEMPAFFAHADAMLVTLKNNPVFDMTVPYKVQCYMACGKPIIAALNGEGARIITQANAGKAVPASNVERLAEAIVAVMGLDAATLKALGENARAYYLDHYEADQINANLEHWLLEAANAASN